jgi:cellulose biosynthesis protein BcsQ
MKRFTLKESEPPIAETPNALGQLRQEARVALDLAVVALAPSQLVERLATSVGLLESLGELPTDSPPVVAMVPDTIARARRSLDEWRTWHQQHLAKRIPSG